MHIYIYIDIYITIYIYIYITIYILQTPGRELYHQTSLMTNCIITGMYSSFEHMHSIIHACTCTCTLSLYFCCIWGHAHLYTHHFQAIATTILSLYPQGLNEQGMTPGFPLNLAFLKLSLVDTYYIGYNYL